MPNIEWTRSRLKWHNMIGFYAGWGKAVLRRAGIPDRACVACVTQFTPVERRGMVSNPEDMKARVSALAPDGVTLLSPEPDQNKGDVRVVFDKDGVTEQRPYKIVVTPKRQEPQAGVTLFWTLQVRR